jgi:hypothetical protein
MSLERPPPPHTLKTHVKSFIISTLAWHTPDSRRIPSTTLDASSGLVYMCSSSLDSQFPYSLDPDSLEHAPS